MPIQPAYTASKGRPTTGPSQLSARYKDMTQSCAGQRVHQAIDFSIRHFRLQLQDMDCTIEPASLPPSRVTWMVGQR
jgi:hypothetical protein